MKNVELLNEINSEINLYPQSEPQEIKLDPSDKVNNFPYSLQSSDLKTTQHFDKSNSQYQRKDINGVPIIRGEKSHSIVFKDNVALIGNSSNNSLVEVIEIESFKKCLKLLNITQKYNNHNTCGVCIIT
jgi:hypothetical protein